MHGALVYTRIPYDSTLRRLTATTTQSDLGKEKNFFESRATEYRSGASLSWEQRL
jgi:hypothetical protein